ncbi:hypothetical protein [Haloarchaeobius iranensis]|uniref:Uncharacterized protein n=1 Tax=Haloarchaeobius iranensis TaxID=996166 RepID=A0A1G9VUR1_9EURY|nr:hypothetical protein [Haloarchaeobius iranensis]SDM75979.1 hypothetical protein SAMN05192554_10715 [Haloarchaeobius iranensis]
MNETSRRRLLAATGTAATSALLAGCSTDSGDGDGTPTGTAGPATDETATDQQATTTEATDAGAVAGSGQLRDWIPTMDAFAAEIPAANFYAADMAAIVEQRDSFSAGTLEQIGRTLVGPSLVDVVPLERRGQVVQIPPARTVVLETAMSDDELVTALTDAGFSETGSQGEATLLEGETNGVGTTAAVVDGVVVQSFGNADNFEPVLGARAGTTDRLLPNNSELRTVVESIGDSELLIVFERRSGDSNDEPALEGSTAAGYGWQFGADTTELTLGVTYAEGEMRDPSNIADYFTERPGVSDYGNFENTVTGRTLLVTGSAATSEFDLLQSSDSGGESTRQPQVQWAFEFESGTMTVTHEAGDSVSAAALTLAVGDSPADTQFADQYDEVTAGDSIDVAVSDVESGTTVRLLWSADGSTVTLGRTQVP